MLYLYTAETVTSTISTDDTQPFVSSHNKKKFHPDVHRLYLRNDSTNEWYSNVQVIGTSTQGNDIYSGTGYFGLKFSVGPNRPTERMWNAIAYNHPAEFQPIGTVAVADTSTFYPFWARVDVSPGSPVAFYQGQFYLSCVAHSV